MKQYLESLRTLFLRLSLVLIIYQLSRVLFYIYNKGTFSGIGWNEFLGGLRFDLSAIFYTNIVFIALHTIPGRFKYTFIYQRILKLLFFLVNALFIATNFIDFEYYKFTSKRSSLSLITASGMQGDLSRLIPVFLKDYWYLCVGFVLIIFLFWKCIPNLRKNKIEVRQRSTPFNITAMFVVFLLSMAVALVAGRGGFQKVPLKIADAIKHTDNSINTALVLNTPFTILKTLGKGDNVKKKNYFDENQLTSIYNPVIHLNSEEQFNKKNIVILILESFGKENLFLEFEGKKLTPFIDSLTTESKYYINAFANGRKSIDAVPSVAISIPCLMEISYISSPYSVNKIEGFNNILKAQGYHTAFFHGAFNGSQGFDNFAHLANYDEYYGRNEYGGSKEDEDGVWGVFDEKFLQFYAKKMSAFKAPFFTTLFTISSHNPYTIPKEYKGKFSKGNRKIHESIAYTDYGLKQFFKTASKEAWYNNTVFIITADHTSADDKIGEYYNNAVGNYDIPILFFDPSNSKSRGEETKLFQQIDILPEVLAYLNYSGSIFSFGNAATAAEDRVVGNFNEGLYHFIIDDYYLCYDGEQIVKAAKYKEDKLLINNLKSNLPIAIENKMKAYIQQFNNRVIDNKLTHE